MFDFFTCLKKRTKKLDPLVFKNGFAFYAIIDVNLIQL